MPCGTCRSPSVSRSNTRRPDWRLEISPVALLLKRVRALEWCPERNPTAQSAEQEETTSTSWGWIILLAFAAREKLSCSPAQHPSFQKPFAGEMGILSSQEEDWDWCLWGDASQSQRLWAMMTLVCFARSELLSLPKKHGRQLDLAVFFFFLSFFIHLSENEWWQLLYHC